MDSNVVFPAIELTAPGEYVYTVRELPPPSGYGCWQADKRVYRIVINVVKSKAGKLTARLKYPDGFPEFTNVCCCRKPDCLRMGLLVCFCTCLCGCCEKRQESSCRRKNND